MNYLNYLKENLSGEFNTITEETNFNTRGDTLVYKKFTGTNFYSSRVLPIQLEVYTNDINKYMGVLSSFASSNTSTTIIQGLSYAKQSFQTPQVLNQWNERNADYVATIILNGTLIISDNISDIKEVYIDNEFIEYSTVDLVYAAVADLDSLWGEDIGSSVIREGNNSLTISTISKNTALNQKIKNIRKGLISANAVFEIELRYIENDEIEKYDMKLTGAALSSSNENMPMNLLTFSQ